MQASRLKIYELINDLKRLEINKLRSNKLRKANTFRDLCALYDGTSTKHFDYRPSKEASTQSSSSSSATTQDDCDTSESSLLSNGIGGEEQIEDSIYTDIDGDFDTSGDGNNNINSINLGDKEELHELENLKKLPVVINKLFKKYVSTGGANGVKIQYHQRLPLFAAFAGYASVRLGDVALSKYKVELSNLFHTKYFDKKQEVKFGRRAGKSYLACVIIACLLISQDNCSGTFICYDKILATVNLITIQRILEEIINDPEQGYSNVKVELSKADNTISVITGRETNKALINKVRCTANPSKASMRGKGNHKGFMFLDESDFYPQKVFDEIMPIAALNILVCFYSSQGFSEAPASRMVKTSILANGRRVWRQFRMTPGRVSLVISEDYGNVSRDMASDLIVSRKESNNLNSKINVVPSVSDIPVRSTMRPWYSPVAQTLALRRKELQSASARKEQWSSLLNNSTSLPSPPSSKTSVSTQPPASSSSTSTTATPLRQKSSKDININEIGGFVPFSSGKCKRVITNKTMNLIKSNNDRLSSIISQTDILNENEWTTDECIFLATLPEQTPPGQMMALKYDMGPEAFAREMLNKEESVNAVLVEAFDGFLIDSVFNPDNYVDPSASRNGDPLYWIIALDPGGVGASDTFIVSALVLEKDLPPLVNDTTSTFSIEMLTRSNNSASASTSSSSAHKKNVNIAESLVSSSLKHKILISGAEFVPKDKSTNPQVVAQLILSHICALSNNKGFRPAHKFKNLKFHVICEKNNNFSESLRVCLMSEVESVSQYNPDVVPDNICVFYQTEYRHGEQVQSSTSGYWIDNTKKATAVSRLNIRLRQGISSIAVSTQFTVTMPDPDDDKRSYPVERILQLMKRQWANFRIIPPVISKKKMITFSGKYNGLQDDSLCALFVLELGDDEITRGTYCHTPHLCGGNRR